MASMSQAANAQGGADAIQEVIEEFQTAQPWTRHALWVHVGVGERQGANQNGGLYFQPGYWGYHARNLYAQPQKVVD